jgi:hypothetical protein
MVDAIGERRPSIRNTVGIGVIFLLSGLVLDYFFTRQNVGLRVELSLTIVAFFVTVTGVVLSIAGGTGLQFQRAIRIALYSLRNCCSIERRADLSLNAWEACCVLLSRETRYVPCGLQPNVDLWCYR